MSRPQKFEIELSGQALKELEALSRSRTLGAGVVRPAEIVLASADGESNSSIARRLQSSVGLVGHWRRRYWADGIAGLYDGPRPGLPRQSPAPSTTAAPPGRIQRSAILPMEESGAASPVTCWHVLASHAKARTAAPAGPVPKAGIQRGVSGRSMTAHFQHGRAMG